MTKVFNSAIMTALLLYPLCWHAVPTFSLQVLMFYFLFLVTFVSFCQIWAVLWRARGLRLCPKVRARSSRRRRSTVSPGLRSLGSEMVGRSPPAAACESSLTSARSISGLVSRNAVLLLQNIFQTRVQADFCHFVSSRTMSEAKGGL